MENLKDALVKYGQYRDFDYIDEDGNIDETRCLIVPAKYVEFLVESDKPSI